MLWWFLPYNVHQPCVSTHPVPLEPPPTSQPSRSSQSAGLSALCYRATSYYFTHSLVYTGGGHGNPLPYSRLGNPTDGGAGRTTVHGVARSWTRVSDWTGAHVSVVPCQSAAPSPFPTGPPVHSLRLRLRSYPADRFISTILIYKMDKQHAPDVWHGKVYSLSSDQPYWKRIWKSIYIYTHICIQTHITESLCCTVKINKTL